MLVHTDGPLSLSYGGGTGRAGLLRKGRVAPQEPLDSWSILRMVASRHSVTPRQTKLIDFRHTGFVPG